MMHGNLEPENNVWEELTPEEAKVEVEQDPIKAHVDALVPLIDRQGGTVEHLITSNSVGKLSKKIVIEYDIQNTGSS